MNHAAIFETVKVLYEKYLPIKDCSQVDGWMNVHFGSVRLMMILFQTSWMLFPTLELTSH